MSRSKVNPSLQILIYSTPHPKLETQIGISIFVGATSPLWHLGINSFWCQIISSFEFTRLHLRLTSFLHLFGSSLGLDIPGDSFEGFLFVFTHWGLLDFYFFRELHASCAVIIDIKWLVKLQDMNNYVYIYV